MRITDLLDRRSVSLTAAPKTKSETLDMAVDLMVKSEKISDREAYRKQVYLREEESTTGIGEGIAIPHGKCDAVKKPGLAAMVIKNGVDVVDDYFNKIKKDLAAYIAVNEEHVDCAIDYLMIAKYLERLGDHAVNICEWVQFYKTGMHKSERIL